MRPDSFNLRRAAIDLIKETIWYLFNRYRQGGERNICLFSTRRGGSTLLMELIAVNKGVRFCDQPFSIKSSLSGQIRYLPIFDRSQVVTLDEEDEAMVRLYLEKIFAGELSVQAPWKFWRRDFDIVADRMVLKIVDAKGIIDWVGKTFPVEIVYSTRHPIPTALSIIRNNWELTAKAYLNDEQFVGRYLTSDQEAYSWDVLGQGTVLQKHILNWCLENITPLRLIPKRPHWHYISFEELSVYPEETVKKLSENLGLPEYNAMLKKLRQPSRSTKKSSTREAKNMIIKADHEALIGAWRRKIDGKDEKKAFDVMEKLEIDLYRYGDNYPHDPTCP